MNHNLLDDELHASPFIDNLIAHDRWVSMIKDHFICSFIIVSLAIPFSFFNLDDLKILDTMFFLVFGFYFNKDILGARSIAKRISGQVIIDIKTGQAASEIKCAIRNFTITFWMVEAIVIYFSPSRRIGDFIAGTKVVRTNPVSFADTVSELNKINKTRSLISVIISMIYAWTMVPIFSSLIFYCTSYLIDM